MPYMESLGFDSSTTVHRSMSIPRQFMKAVPWSWVPNRPTDPPHHPGPTLDPPSLHCRADPPHDPLLIRAGPTEPRPRAHGRRAGSARWMESRGATDRVERSVRCSECPELERNEERLDRKTRGCFGSSERSRAVGICRILYRLI